MADGIYYIYKITNKINNKIYIGFTSQNPKKRLLQHFRKAKYGTISPLNNAIRKYGKENFIVETIETNNALIFLHIKTSIQKKFNTIYLYLQ